MRRSRIPAILALSLVASVGSKAWAAHDLPSKAASIKVDLVRAYTPCTAPNDVHDSVLVIASACSPATPLSDYRFGPQGQGRAQVQLISGGIKLRFDLKDVRTSGDVPVDGISFSGRVQLRITDHGCSAAISCVVESSLGVDLACSKGRCSANTLYSDLFLPAGLEGAAEVTRIDVMDDTEHRFATAGILLH